MPQGARECRGLLPLLPPTAPAPLHSAPQTEWLQANASNWTVPAAGLNTQVGGGPGRRGGSGCSTAHFLSPPIPRPQRVAYGVTTFVVKPPYHAPPPPPPLPGADPVTTVLAPMGIVAAVLGMLFACYVAYKHGLAAKVAAAARARALAQSHPGLSAFTEVAANRPPSVFVPASKETVDEHPLSKPRRAPSFVRSESAAEASELAARLLMRAGADAALYSSSSSSSSAAVAKPAAAVLASDTYAPPPQASRNAQADAACVPFPVLSLCPPPPLQVASAAPLPAKGAEAAIPRGYGTPAPAASTTSSSSGASSSVGRTPAPASSTSAGSGLRTPAAAPVPAPAPFAVASEWGAPVEDPAAAAAAGEDAWGVVGKAPAHGEFDYEPPAAVAPRHATPAAAVRTPQAAAPTPAAALPPATFDEWT